MGFALSATENIAAIGQDAFRGSIYRVASWRRRCAAISFLRRKNNNAWSGIYLGTHIFGFAFDAASSMLEIMKSIPESVI